MNMFNWLTKKGISPISKETSISMFVLLQMEKYIQESKNLIELCPDTKAYSELYTSLSFLKSAGLGSTKNARVIEAKIAEINAQTNAIDKAKELMAFVKSLRKHFGEGVLLVGSEQFDEICKKYKLVTGCLEDYTGTIPESSIQAISKAKKLVHSFSEKRHLQSMSSIGGVLMKVDTVRNEGLTDEMKGAASALVDYLKMNNNIIVVDNVSSYTSLKSCLSHNEDLPRACKRATHPGLICLQGKELSRDFIFVACPPSQLKEQKLEFIQKPIDPIVFHRTPYGIVIYTMWGEEAEDAVFEEYKRLNNLMSL